MDCLDSGMQPSTFKILYNSIKIPFFFLPLSNYFKVYIWTNYQIPPTLLLLLNCFEFCCKPRVVGVLLDMPFTLVTFSSY